MGVFEKHKSKIWIIFLCAAMFIGGASMQTKAGESEKTL